MVAEPATDIVLIANPPSRSVGSRKVPDRGPQGLRFGFRKAGVVTGDRAAGIPTEEGRENAAYAARIRRTNERLAYAVCALFAATGLLPFTEERYRAGVLLAAALLFVLALIWFRVVPPTAFGDRRVVVFSLLLQPLVIVLLSLTDGIESPFLPYLLVSVLITVYSPRTRHTIVVGIAAALSLVVVAVADGDRRSAAVVVGRLTIDLFELSAFVLFAAVIGRALREARRAITARAETRAAEREEAVREANTDVLTGLYNRRYADDVLVRSVAEAERGRPFSIIALDVDDLKQANDQRGHEAGDRVLKRVAETLRRQLRGADLAIRLGGDEFLALLPGTRHVQAQAVAARLRRAVETHDWSDVADEVSISCGAAEWQEGQTGADVVKAADKRLYEAKRARPQSA